MKGYTKVPNVMNICNSVAFINYLCCHVHAQLRLADKRLNLQWILNLYKTILSFLH